MENSLDVIQLCFLLQNETLCKVLLVCVQTGLCFKRPDAHTIPSPQNNDSIMKYPIVMGTLGYLNLSRLCYKLNAICTNMTFHV